MSEPLVFDQGKVDIGAELIGEEHAQLISLLHVAMERLRGKIRFIQVNPLALTLIQSGSMSMFPRPALAIDLSQNRAEPTEIGTWYGFPLCVDGFARDERAVLVFGTNGEVETIEIRNASFI